jgi:TM2 domain-containing membrane protein YozV
MDMDTDSLKYGIFSFIIPGLGQYLKGDGRKGLGMFAGAVALHIFIWFFMNNILGSGVQTLYHIYSGFDAYKNY